MADISVANLTHRRVLNIAVPIVLANATVPLLGLVDTGVVGQLGLAAPIGAVGIGAVIISAIYWVFGFLRMGTTGLTSQAIGAGDDREASALIIRALFIGLSAGGLFILLQVPLFWAAFQISPASGEVETLARSYLQIRIFSAPAAIALFGITGWLIAHERTRAVLVLQIWMNGLNVLLDFWFVLGLDLGVSGVAFATFLAEWTGLLFGLWLCRSSFKNNILWDVALLFDRSRLRRMAVVNGDIMLRSVLLQAAIMSFLFLGSAIDDVTLAANQVLFQFLHLTVYALDGFAFSAETLVGQALGAGARPALRRAAILTSLWGLIIVLVLTAVFAIGGGKLVDLMTTAPDVRHHAREFLPWILATPLIGIGSWMLDGIFIGATRTREMRNTMVVSTMVFAVSVWLLFEQFGNHGLWASLMIFFAARAVTLGFYYPDLERSADPSI